jgi:hypothetical protein
MLGSGSSSSSSNGGINSGDGRDDGGSGDYMVRGGGKNGSVR